MGGFIIKNMLLIDDTLFPETTSTQPLINDAQKESQGIQECSLHGKTTLSSRKEEKKESFRISSIFQNIEIPFTHPSQVQRSKKTVKYRGQASESKGPI